MPQAVRVFANAVYLSAFMVSSADAGLLQGGHGCAAPADVRRVLPAVAARRVRVPSPQRTGSAMMRRGNRAAPTATGAGVPGSAAVYTLAPLAGTHSPAALPAALPGTPAPAPVLMASWPALSVSENSAAACAWPCAHGTCSDAALSSASVPRVGLAAAPLPEPFDKLGGPWGVDGRPWTSADLPAEAPAKV